MYYLCSGNKGADQFAQLICAFVFAYAKSRFSHDATHLKEHVNIYIGFIMAHLVSLYLNDLSGHKTLNYVLFLDCLSFSAYIISVNGLQRNNKL